MAVLEDQELGIEALDGLMILGDLDQVFRLQDLQLLFMGQECPHLRAYRSLLQDLGLLQLMGHTKLMGLSFKLPAVLQLLSGGLPGSGLALLQWGLYNGLLQTLALHGEVA